MIEEALADAREALRYVDTWETIPSPGKGAIAIQHKNPHWMFLLVAFPTESGGWGFDGTATSTRPGKLFVLRLPREIVQDKMMQLEMESLKNVFRSS